MIDVDSVAAIDVHAHAEVSRSGQDGMPPEFREAAARYFKSDTLPTADDVAVYYRERNIAAVIFTVDFELQSGRPPIPNEEIAEVAAANSDVLIPFASVDPARGAEGIRRARRLIEEHGVKGFKFPGGGGLRLKYSNPMCLDDVAADFPELKIVLAHPSFPWQDEAISICLHKANVWIDLSGWSPKYFPPQLVQYANAQLRTKVLFGSDYPLITPDRWLADFEALPLKDEVRPLILKENAATLLGLR